jgi:hypothetical protein
MEFSRFEVYRDRQTGFWTVLEKIVRWSPVGNGTVMTTQDVRVVGSLVGRKMTYREAEGTANKLNSGGGI